MSTLVAIPVKEGEFTKEEHEETAILLENYSKEKVLRNALRSFYEKPYVIKMFNQCGEVKYYKIMRDLSG